MIKFVIEHTELITLKKKS